MPVQYDSVLEEHAAVRNDVGVFDVSHLGRFEVAGPGAVDLLRSQLCNDIMRIGPGRAQYTMALNGDGGIEDDIIVWWLEDDVFWVMPNGTNFDEILIRFETMSSSAVGLTDVRSRTALLAVQGPNAPTLVEGVLGSIPGRFRVERGSFDGHEIVSAGTGYTGERGVEICAPIEASEALWDALVDAGAKPAGLGARDTLRLEMGYPLWGQDLTDTTTPIEAGLGWVVSWEHEFVGKQALEAIRDHPPSALVAFTTEGRAIPRHGYPVTTTTGSGEVTSGNFSPTLGHGIGLAHVTPPPRDGETMTVAIRGKDVPATIVDLPFLDK
jgi:aminomethyltransferase